MRANCLWTETISQWFVLICCVAIMPAVATGTPAMLRISQALVEGRAITAYLEVRDEAGFVPDISAGQLHATLATHVASIRDLKPFAATGDGVVYLFLVDISRSMSARQFMHIRQALRDWVAAMEPVDYAALVSFGDGVRTLVEPTADREALIAAIETLRPTDRNTALHAALARGMALGQQRLTELPDRRAIVILSDGEDDAPGGMRVEEVHALIQENPIPIYAIGFSSISDRTRREAGLAALGRFGRGSGGSYLSGDSAENLVNAYAALRTRIREVYQVSLQCEACVFDGNRYRLQVSLRDGGLTLTDGIDLRLLPNTTTGPAVTAAPADTAEGEPAAAWLRFGPWPYLTGGMTLLFLLVALIIHVRRQRAAAPAPTPAGKDENAWSYLLPGDGSSHTLNPPHPGPQSESDTRVQVIFMNGARRGEKVTLQLSPSAVIGRGQSCHLALPDDSGVSSRHAELATHASGRVVLRDLGSINSTYLNGIAIQTTHPVEDGDVIRIGQTQLRIML